MMPAVRFRSVSKRFPGPLAPARVGFARVSFARVSFDINAAACHAIMGENGAGKSTPACVSARIGDGRN